LVNFFLEIGEWLGSIGSSHMESTGVLDNKAVASIFLFNPYNSGSGCINIYFVRGIEAGNGACWQPDNRVVIGDHPGQPNSTRIRTIEHEMGHAQNLPHSSFLNNLMWRGSELMSGSEGGTELSCFQKQTAYDYCPQLGYVPE
jgi:hypothetical protein